MPFLTLDHINNDGAAARQGNRDTKPLYRRLRRANYPLGYQVLCWNCNVGRHINGGVCPHQAPA